MGHYARWPTVDGWALKKPPKGPGDLGKDGFRPSLGFGFSIAVEDQAHDLVKENLGGVDLLELVA